LKDLAKQHQTTEPNHFLAQACTAPELVENELEILFGGTKTYGRMVTPAVVSAWLLALRASGVTLAELQIAVEWWVAKIGGETPEPRAMVAFIEEKRVDVARMRELRACIEVETAEDDAARRAQRLRTYGTENPTIEQRRAHWDAIGLTVTPERILGMTPAPKKWTQEDESKRQLTIQRLRDEEE